MASSWVGICLVLFLSVQLAWAQESKTYSVGDGAGWTYINASSGQPADYPGWAAKYQFFVKDVLRFNYEPGQQSIYLFPKKQDWDSCNVANGKVLDNGTLGYSEWGLPFEAYYNFASGMYCEKGQKFRILADKNVGTGGVEAPIPAPSPSKQGPAPTLKVPTTAPESEPSVSPLFGSALAPASDPVSASPPASIPVSASAPATWGQTLILAAAGVVAANMFKL